MMMRISMSDFIEVCKFNEAMNRDIEEDFYDNEIEEDEDDDDDAWWNDLRQTESISKPSSPSTDKQRG